MLSVVVPIKDERDNLPRLHEEITRALKPLVGAPGPSGLSDYEVLLVDDGSTDDSLEVLQRIAAADPRMKVIALRRNYGQTPAMAAGIQHARGEVLVTMDGDLQNDPADIPLFLEKMREGNDIVVGWRHNRQDKLITRKIPSRIANWLIGKVTGVPIRDNGCSLKAYRGALIKEIPLYSEMHRFIPAMASIAGPRIAEIKVRHHARQFGSSKYGLSRIYKVFFDMIAIKTLLVFVRKPGIFFVGAGCFAGLLALLSLAVAMIDASDMAQDPTVVMMGVSALLGSLALFLIFGGMVSYLFYQTIVRRRELSVAIGSRRRGLPLPSLEA